MLVDDMSRLIDQVFRWPVTIIVFIPSEEIVVQSNRISDSGFLDCFTDILLQLFEGEFWSMDTDDHESVFFICIVPGVQLRLCADAVDAVVFP